MINIGFCGNRKNTLQITCDDSDILDILRDEFSMANPAFSSKRKYIPSRLYAITPTGRFDSGLLEDIIQNIQTHGFQFKIDLNVSSYFKKNLTVDRLVSFGGYDYRKYQSECLWNVLRAGRGICLVGTGGGKTLITAGIIENIRKVIKKSNGKVLIIVPTLQLIEQTSLDLIEYGIQSVSKLSGKHELDINSDVIIAGMSYLSRTDDSLAFLSEMDILIVDECHILAAGNEISKILKYIQTPYTFGLTGSMPESKINHWSAIGKLGPIIYTKKTKELQDEKFLSPFEIFILNIKHGGKIFSRGTMPTDRYRAEIDYLVSCDYRNNTISKLALRLKTNTIIMVDRVQHGHTLKKIISDLNINRKVFFIFQETSVEERENIRKLLEVENEIIVIAISKIFSTGINIKNLHNIIFASAGKAKIKLIQSIGRTLRLHESKKMAMIFDISDDTYYGQLHKNARIKLYEKESYKYIEKYL